MISQGRAIASSSHRIVVVHVAEAVQRRGDGIVELDERVRVFIARLQSKTAVNGSNLRRMEHFIRVSK